MYIVDTFLDINLNLDYSYLNTVQKDLLQVEITFLGILLSAILIYVEYMAAKYSESVAKYVIKDRKFILVVGIFTVSISLKLIIILSRNSLPVVILISTILTFISFASFILYYFKSLNVLSVKRYLENLKKEMNKEKNLGIRKRLLNFIKLVKKYLKSLKNKTKKEKSSDIMENLSNLINILINEENIELLKDAFDKFSEYISKEWMPKNQDYEKKSFYKLGVEIVSKYRPFLYKAVKRDNPTIVKIIYDHGLKKILDSFKEHKEELMFYTLLHFFSLLDRVIIYSIHIYSDSLSAYTAINLLEEIIKDNKYKDIIFKYEGDIPKKENEKENEKTKLKEHLEELLNDAESCGKRILNDSFEYSYLKIAIEEVRRTLESK